MSISDGRNAGPIRLKLPATSANLGSGFDAAAIALDFHLEIEAAAAENFSINATGRDAERCSRIENNLIVGVYEQILSSNDKPILPLSIVMKNGIPLGMGCGSSAAGRLAGIVLAVHFGNLEWSSDRVLQEVSILEGHPDNAAACWLGGFVTAACEGRLVHVGRVEPPAAWRAIVVLPSVPLATSKARAILPDSYSRDATVHNIQAVSLLGLAFAQGREDLLLAAMRDEIHQPYRYSVCPMLPRLLPLAGQHGILGVALSGAGPAVLVIARDETRVPEASKAILEAVFGLADPELKICRFPSQGVKQFTD